jgi:hypothetical protein
MNSPTDIEEWKTIPGFDLYEASTWGSIRRRKNQRLLGQQPFDDYARVSVCVKGVRTFHRAHRLVALTFIPNPENKPYIDHIDENKRNNHISNLRWVSASENMLYYYQNKKGSLTKEKRLYLKFENDDITILFDSMMSATKHFEKSKGTIFSAYRRSLVKQDYKWNGYRITRATPEEIITINEAI